MKYKGGAVLRTGVSPTLLTRKSEWNFLSSANKTLWNAYAVSYSKDNYYAETKILNGFNWYVSINNNLVRCGSAITATPPARTLPLAVPVMSLIVDGNGVYFVPAAPYALGNNALIIFTTPQVSNMFLKQRSKFRYTTIQASGTVSGSSLTAAWQTVHNTTYPLYTSEMSFNIIAMFIHIEKTSGLATVGTFAIDGINTFAGGIGDMIIENNFVIS
jgi:hypothetical protein